MLGSAVVLTAFVELIRKYLGCVLRKRWPNTVAYEVIDLSSM